MLPGDGVRLRTRKKARDSDPLAAFDALLEDLELQGQEVRKSAATLLATQSELNRSLERYSRRLLELGQRKLVAERTGSEPKVKGTLDRDRMELERQESATREALAKVEVDAQLLTETATKLREQREELKLERTSASARLLAGKAVHVALREQAERFKKVIDVDAARDEVERAHALADLYREDSDEEAP